MCGSMVDIQSTAAEIRQGKTELKVHLFTWNGCVIGSKDLRLKKLLKILSHLDECEHTKAAKLAVQASRLTLDVTFLTMIVSGVHCVSKKSHLLTCFDIHGSITIIFGISVTETIGNQNILHFPTSPNLCLCTTWGNSKPKNCVFFT